MAGIKKHKKWSSLWKILLLIWTVRIFYIIKQTIKHSCPYILYLLSLCLHLLEFRPKNSANFKNKNLNTFLYVDVVILFFKIASNCIQETKRAPNTVFLSRKLHDTIEYTRL